MMVMMIMMTIDFDENDDAGNGKYPFDNLAAGGWDRPAGCKYTSTKYIKDPHPGKGSKKVEKVCSSDKRGSPKEKNCTTFFGAFSLPPNISTPQTQMDTKYIHNISTLLPIQHPEYINLFLPLFFCTSMSNIDIGKIYAQSTHPINLAHVYLSS